MLERKAVFTLGTRAERGTQGDRAEPPKNTYDSSAGGAETQKDTHDSRAGGAETLKNTYDSSAGGAETL